MALPQNPLAPARGAGQPCSRLAPGAIVACRPTTRLEGGELLYSLVLMSAQRRSLLSRPPKDAVPEMSPPRTESSGPPAIVLVLLLLVAVAPICQAQHESGPAIQDAEPTTGSERQASVTVLIKQLDITIVPRSIPSISCAKIGIDDLRLSINGQPRQILGLDPVGHARRSSTPDRPPEVADSVPPGLTMLLVFDEESLGRERRRVCGHTRITSSRGMGAYGASTRALAWAREMLERAFHDGDRVAISSFSGWPRIHTPWIDNQKDALLALDEFEADSWLFRSGGTHANDLFWWRGWTDLVDALGSYPGRKDVFLLASDVLATAEQAEEMAALSQHAQAGRVVIHTVDLAWDRRILPLGLGPFARHLGGQMFTNGQRLTDAVEAVRDRDCRFVLSFRPDEDDGRSFPPRIRVEPVSKEFEVRFGVSYDDETDAPSTEASNLPRLLLPQWGEGIEIEAGLWPLSPLPGGRRWNALLLARITVDDPLAIPGKSSLEAVVSRGSKIEWHGEKNLLDLEPRDREGSKRVVAFPLTVPTGLIEFHVGVRDADGSFIAVFRSGVEFERVRRPADAEHWYLSEGLGKVGQRLVPLPILSGQIREGKGPLLVGYLCASDKGEIRTTSPVVIHRRDARRIDLVVKQLGRTHAGSISNSSCRWVAATPVKRLGPGVWDLFTDGESNLEREAPSLAFRVE